MKLYHKTPCTECPWRKKAPAGWLGGFTPYEYADTVGNNEAPACHNKDHGPESPKTAFCAGALAVASNSCTSLWKAPGADEAKEKVGTRTDCFQWVRDFYEHHAKKKYRPLIERILSGEEE